MEAKRLIFHACGTGGAIGFLCFMLFVSGFHAHAWLKFTVASVGILAVIGQEWSNVSASNEGEDLDGLLIVLAEIIGVLIGLALSLLYWH